MGWVELDCVGRFCFCFCFVESLEEGRRERRRDGGVEEREERRDLAFPPHSCRRL